MTNTRTEKVCSSVSQVHSSSQYIEKVTSEWSSVTASSIVNIHRTKMNSSHDVIISRTQTIPTVSLMLVTSIVYANNISSTSYIFSSTAMPSFNSNASYRSTTYSEERSVNASQIKSFSFIFSNNSQTLIKTRTRIILINSSSVSTSMPGTAVLVSLTILPTTAKVTPTSSLAQSNIDSANSSLIFSTSPSANTKMSASINSTKTKFVSSSSTFSIISIEANNYSSTINSVINYSLLSSPASSGSVSFAISKHYVLISSYEPCWVTFYINETDSTSMTPVKPILSTKINASSNILVGIESTSVVSGRVRFSAENVTAVNGKSLLVSVTRTSIPPEENRTKNVTILNTSTIIEASFSTVVLLQINSTSPTTLLTSFQSLSVKNPTVKTSRNSMSFVSQGSTIHTVSSFIAAQTSGWKSSTSTIANMTSKETSIMNLKSLAISSSVNVKTTSVTVVNSTKLFNSQTIFDSTSFGNTSEKAAVLNRRRNIENGTSQRISEYIMFSTTISSPLLISSSKQINVTSLLNTASRFVVRITSSLEGILTTNLTKPMHPATASLSIVVTAKGETMIGKTRNIFSSILNSTISSNGTNTHGGGTVISKMVSSSRGVSISSNKTSSSNKISSLNKITTTLVTSTVSSSPSLPKAINASESPNTASRVETKISPRYSHNVRNQSSVKVMSLMLSSQSQKSVSAISHATQLLTSALGRCLRISTVAMRTSVPSSGIFSLTSAQLHTSTSLRTNFSTTNSLSTLLTKQLTKATDFSQILSLVISTYKNATSSYISSSVLSFSSSLSFAPVSFSSKLKVKLTSTITNTNMSLSSSTMKKSTAQINTSSIAPSTESKSTSTLSSAAVLTSAKISSVSATTTTGVVTRPSSKSTSLSLSSKRKPISTTIKESNTLILTSGTKTTTVSQNSFESSIMAKTPTATLAASSSAAASVAPPASNFSLILMLVLNDSSVDVTVERFKSDLEQKLVDMYVDLGSIIKKRRRREARNGNTAVEILSIVKTRNVVDVEFIVKDSNITVPADEAAKRFNYLSPAGLQKRLEYKVLGPVQVKQTPTVPPTIPPTVFQQTDVIGMVVDNPTQIDLTLLKNQNDFKTRLLAFYQVRDTINGNLTVQLVRTSTELNQTMYVEFYITVNDTLRNSTLVVNFFEMRRKEDLEVTLAREVIRLPYLANPQVTYQQINLVEMFMTPNNDIPDYTDSNVKSSLASNISLVYMRGKFTHRQKKALSSVVTLLNGISKDSANQVHVTFAVVDEGVLKTGPEAATTMNRVSITDMLKILDAKQINSNPTPVVSSPVPASSDPPYWILAAIIGPVIAISLCCVLICWRWKRGGPKPKVSPVETNDEKDGVNNNISTAEEKVIEKNQREQVSLAVTSPINDFRSSDRDDEFRVSQRRKIKSSLRHQVPTGRQNEMIQEESDEGAEKEDSEYDVTDEEEESEPVRKPELEPTEIQIKRDIKKKLIHEENQKSRAAHPPKPPPRRTPSPVRSQHLSVSSTSNGRSSFGLQLDDEESFSTRHHSAGHVPSFGKMTEPKSLSVQTPVRFRKTFESNMEKYTKPAGPLPILNLNKTSLMGAPQAEPSNQFISTLPKPEPKLNLNAQMDSDLQHKAEVERLRNKQRQREQLFSAQPFSQTVSTSSRNSNRAWRHQQHRIEAVLDPVSSMDEPGNLSIRKKRARRRIRRKNKIYMETNPVHLKNEEIELKSFKETKSPVKEDTIQQVQENKIQAASIVESDIESDISMREARRRIHSLLDDTFSSLKKYQRKLLADEKNTEEEEANTKSKLQKTPSQDSNNTINSPIKRHAGMPPALPEPPLAHGRASTPPVHQPKRKLMAQDPYAYNSGLFADPLLTWDPIERQRYINQRMGYPVYGPVAGSLGVPYGPSNGHNVYVTPVHQRPDGMGGYTWTPYPREDFSNNTVNPSQTYPHTNPVPGMNSIPRDYIPDIETHSTMLNMADKKNSSQPLIRAIKEELLKLSQKTPGRTKVQELNGVTLSASGT